jgi:hypothetical protein
MRKGDQPVFQKNRIWSACKSIVITLVAPAVSNNLAVSFASELLACLFYLVLPNRSKELAVMCLADARFAASIIVIPSVV